MRFELLQLLLKNGFLFVLYAFQPESHIRLGVGARPRPALRPVTLPSPMSKNGEDVLIGFI